ncbi:MAG TPA: GAF domain-containing protein [Vicinamibacterales bacterium]|nr:GAF domain-containing protein [Vicinamibacterales bacterium]
MRLTLTLLTVGAIATAAYLFLNIDRATATSTAAARDLDARISTATRLTLELRGAQQAYVAAGQSKQFWFTKAAATVAALRESLTGIRASASSGSSHLPLDEALQGLQEFERMDRRARDFASADQNLLASDLIFSDGLETTTQILSALDQARQTESDALGRSEGDGRRGQLMYAGAAAGIAILTVLLLLSTPGAIAIDTASVGPPMIVPDSTEGLDPGATFPMEAPVAQTPTVAVSTPGPDLEHVASVCAELARVSDTASLPSLLERTATALDASGIVLWLADPDGKELTAIASHGYPASMLSRMGAIDREADNVTASAFRTGLLQTVMADSMSNGAIAAPLVNPGGCIGVMSAEVRHDGETQPARLAVATIVAAQLATLVAPPAARDGRTAAV